MVLTFLSYLYPLKTSVKLGKQVTRKVELKLPDSYRLLAIYTVTDDYRLAWLLNNALGLQLQRDEQHSNRGFSLFSDRNSLASTHFVLLSNKNDFKRLFPQYEQINFFLKLSNVNDTQVDEIVKKISNVESINACAVMQEDNKLLKAINKL